MKFKKGLLLLVLLTFSFGLFACSKKPTKNDPEKIAYLANTLTPQISGHNNNDISEFTIFHKALLDTELKNNKPTKKGEEFIDNLVRSVLLVGDLDLTKTPYKEARRQSSLVFQNDDFKEVNSPLENYHKVIGTKSGKNFYIPRDFKSGNSFEIIIKYQGKTFKPPEFKFSKEEKNNLYIKISNASEELRLYSKEGGFGIEVSITSNNNLERVNNIYSITNDPKEFYKSTENEEIINGRKDLFKYEIIVRDSQIVISSKKIIEDKTTNLESKFKIILKFDDNKEKIDYNLNFNYLFADSENESLNNKIKFKSNGSV